jgi:two-component system, chemotaxis family, sensor kinase CheA
LDQTPDKEIVIKYSDDGKGLNLKEIREKAVQRNILSESESEKLKEKDIVSVIFTSGFSISDKADHYSGRGQGLSLVKNLIEELGGNFEILFEKGRFFQIIIRLPHRENDEPNEDVMS